MQPFDAKQEKRNVQFEAFRCNDGVDRTDVIARFIIVSICGMALWFITRQAVMLVWVVGYCAMNTAYIFGLLRRKRGDVSRFEIFVCVFASTFTAAWYCAMIVYIATIENGGLLFLSACGVLGLAFHCLSRHIDFSYAAYVDFAAVIGTGLGVTIATALKASTLGFAVASMIGGLCASVYFWLSFRQIISVNRDLAENTREDIQNHKMLALGQLASGVAHDFNNLLTVISGNIELVLLDPKNPENTGFLLEAKEASDKSAVLVRQLLAYGRKSVLRLSNVELGSVFKELEQLLRRVIPAHIRFEIQDVSLKTDLYLDRALFESALMNLIINAQKAIGEKPGTIRLYAETETSGDRILIYVTDTGPGMAPDVLARAAEPFFTTRSVGEGSGLGLSMAKGFAKQSGGDLTFSNLDGGGFQAVIELPVRSVLS